MSVQLHW